MRVLGPVTVVALAAGLVAGLGLAPREVTQGNVQRIMYLHVPSVCVAYVAFAVVVAASTTPLEHSSAIWWRPLPQPRSLMTPAPAMPRVIITALLVNFVAFSLLYVYFVAKRVHLLRREAEAAA